MTPKEIREFLVSKTLESVVEDILSVQPMNPEILKSVLDKGMTNQQLVERGYKPVSDLGLLYIKE